MFAAMTLVTLGAVGTYLYLSLATELREQDDEELVTTVEAARHRLLETATIQEIRDKPYVFRNLASQRENLVLVLRTLDGETLLAVHAPSAPLPASPPVPGGTPFTDNGLHDWQTGEGTPSRAGVATGRLSNRIDQVEIIVALTSGERATVLRNYRARVVEASLAGALAAALLGMLLARAGLRPLRRLAADAEAVTVNRLQTRLNAKAAPFELQELVTSINGMLDRIEDGFQRLTQFSADVAHDLRTPISNLLGQSQVALSKPRSAEEYQALLASNVEEFERLARMVENMLFLARADNAQIALKTENIDGGRELDSIAEYFFGMAEDRAVSIKVCGRAIGADSGESRIQLLADPSLLRRALHNLLANAIRYTPPGGTICLDAERRAGEVFLSVSNPGPGIEAQHLPHLFDRFYRADPSRSDSAFSAGLGLAIVQSIARLHGGRAEVESHPGETTVFRLVLPVVGEAAGATGGARKAVQP
jgi:two-component system, OmpR family, heavy metal sensor histidine kinase CusS